MEREGIEHLRLIPQVGPIYPEGHRQVKLVLLSIHVPPFLQGAMLHADHGTNSQNIMINSKSLNKTKIVKDIDEQMKHLLYTVLI